MSRIGSFYLELTEDAQSMSRDAFIEKYGMVYVQEWDRLRDPDFYDYPEDDGYDYDY